MIKLSPVDPEEIKQKLLAGTPLTPEELSALSRILETFHRQFDWYVEDLKGWKAFSLSLLDQNRSLTLMCQTFIQNGKAPNH